MELTKKYPRNFSFSIVLGKRNRGGNFSPQEKSEMRRMRPQKVLHHVSIAYDMLTLSDCKIREYSLLGYELYNV